MNTDIKAMQDTDAIDTMEVITGAAADLVYRYDRALACLALVGLAGLLIHGMFALALHPVVAAAVACGFGGVVTLVCISVVWGRWRFVKPLGAAALPLAVLWGVITLVVGAAFWVLWLVLPDPVTTLGGWGIGAEWWAWQALALGAVCAMVPVEATMLAWALRSTSDCGYLDAGIEMLGWPVEKELYNRPAIGLVGFVLALAVLWIPGVALLVPVFVAMFAGNLFYRVWDKRG